MTNFVANTVEKLRNAGFTIKSLNASALWHVEGRGNLSTGQLIDLAIKLDMSQR